MKKDMIADLSRLPSPLLNTIMVSSRARTALGLVRELAEFKAAALKANPVAKKATPIKKASWSSPVDTSETGQPLYASKSLKASVIATNAGQAKPTTVAALLKIAGL